LSASPLARIQTVTIVWSVSSGTSQKIRDSWWGALATYKVAHTIQPREHSTGGGTDGASHKGSVAKINGNRNVPYLNKDDSKRNLNLNWWNNDWNPIYRFLAVRNSRDFSRLNWREFCFAIACAIRRAFGRLQPDIPRGGQIFSYQVPVPRELQKQFQKIDTRNTPVNKHKFFCVSTVTREETVFDRVQKYLVNL